MTFVGSGFAREKAWPISISVGRGELGEEVEG